MDTKSQRCTNTIYILFLKDEIMLFETVFRKQFEHEMNNSFYYILLFYCDYNEKCLNNEYMIINHNISNNNNIFSTSNNDYNYVK